MESSRQLISGNCASDRRDRAWRRRARSWNASKITSLTRRSYSPMLAPSKDLKTSGRGFKLIPDVTTALQEKRVT